MVSKQLAASLHKESILIVFSEHAVCRSDAKLDAHRVSCCRYKERIQALQPFHDEKFLDLLDMGDGGISTYGFGMRSRPQESHEARVRQSDRSPWPSRDLTDFGIETSGSCVCQSSGSSCSSSLKKCKQLILGAPTVHRDYCLAYNVEDNLKFYPR